MTFLRFRHGCGTLLVLAAGLMLGADDPTQKIDAGGMTFKAPSDWKSTPPNSPMRRAQLKVQPAEGDPDPAELIVFGFANGAGSVESNVARWRNTFKDADGNPPKVEVKKVKTGGGVEVTVVEIAGHYYPMAMPSQPKQPDRENYRLLGAVAENSQTSYYLRMTGPDKTVAAARPHFDKLVTSIEMGTK